MDSIYAGRDALLEKLGLQVKRPSTDYVMPLVALFGTGFLVGAGIGLLFAPCSGQDLRQDIAGYLKKTDQIPAQAHNGRAPVERERRMQA